MFSGAESKGSPVNEKTRGPAPSRYSRGRLRPTGKRHSGQGMVITTMPLLRGELLGCRLRRKAAVEPDRPSRFAPSGSAPLSIVNCK